jgi:hypothetical protein
LCFPQRRVARHRRKASRAKQQVWDYHALRAKKIKLYQMILSMEKFVHFCLVCDPVSNRMACAHMSWIPPATQARGNCVVLWLGSVLEDYQKFSAIKIKEKNFVSIVQLATVHIE